MDTLRSDYLLAFRLGRIPHSTPTEGYILIYNCFDTFIEVCSTLEKIIK